MDVSLKNQYITLKANNGSNTQKTLGHLNVFLFCKKTKKIQKKSLQNEKEMLL